MGEKEYSGRGVLNPLFSEKKNTVFISPRGDQCTDSPVPGAGECSFCDTPSDAFC